MLPLFPLFPLTLCEFLYFLCCQHATGLKHRSISKEKRFSQITFCNNETNKTIELPQRSRNGKCLIHKAFLQQKHCGLLKSHSVVTLTITCEGIQELFSKMLQESHVVKDFQMQREKSFVLYRIWS